MTERLGGGVQKDKDECGREKRLRNRNGRGAGEAERDTVSAQGPGGLHEEPQACVCILCLSLSTPPPVCPSGAWLVQATASNTEPPGTATAAPADCCHLRI